jgi:hypothetical protein
MMLSLGLVGVLPAHADCSTSPSQACVGISIIEGLGNVCSKADANLTKLLSPPVLHPRCTYHADAFWTNSPKNDGTNSIADYNAVKADGYTPVHPDLQGLYFPGFGPGAHGPFSFTAGPGTDPGGSGFCVSTVGTSPTGCQFSSMGILDSEPTLPNGGAGAYCGSSQGNGLSIFVSGDKHQTVYATFGWAQSAATILPLSGTVYKTVPAGGEGAQVVGFTSSRGTGDDANCGVSKVTTVFNVEGAVITF